MQWMIVGLVCANDWLTDFFFFLIINFFEYVFYMN